MRTVIQRASHCTLVIDGNTVTQTSYGMMILLGISPDDTEIDVDYLVRKITNLRIFDDNEGVMNRSIVDTGGEILVVSQFTLMADTRKGNRPSYIKAARPDVAIPLYDMFVERLKKASNVVVKTGVFGADMKINFTNDGPVTIIIDSKENNGN